jgi:NADPH2:quinone reductase
VRAISVARFGGPEVLVPVEAPDPVAGPGELVVGVGASDVMFVDTMIRSGRGAGFFPIRPPYVPGSGVGGNVISVGDGVDDGWLGRPVIAHIGGSGGGYAERAVVSLAETVAVPDGLDPLLAAAIIHDGPTALRVTRLVDVRPGEPVLVLGAAGGMGILLVQLLRARGARVIGAARGPAKTAAVGAAGAEVVIDYGQPGWTSLVTDATGGRGPAVVLDGVGGQLGHDAYEVMADGGRFSAHGAPGGGFAAIDPADAGSRKITVTGLGDLQVGPGERADDSRQLLPDLLSGAVRPLVGQTLPLAEAARAHALMEARQAVAKTLLLTSVLFSLLGRQLARVRGDAEVAGRGRDLPGKLDVARAQPADVVRHQSDDDARVPQVNVGMVIGRVGQLADRVDQPDPGPERPGREVSAGDAGRNPPVADAVGFEELLGTDQFSHARKPTRQRRPGT